MGLGGYIVASSYNHICHLKNVKRKKGTLISPTFIFYLLSFTLKAYVRDNTQSTFVMGSCISNPLFLFGTFS